MPQGPIILLDMGSEKPSLAKKALKLCKGALCSLVVVVIGGFAVLTAYYSNIPQDQIRLAVAILIGAGVIGLLLIRPIWKSAVIALGILILSLGWRWQISPSNDREWRIENRQLASLETGVTNEIGVRNVRNFKYQEGGSDLVVRHEDRSYDVRNIRTVDYAISYWGAESGTIAHTFLTFGFLGDQWLSISIEIRAEEGEKYHPFPGFFRQYELIYVVADERDTIGLRIDDGEGRRGEKVYLYPSVASPEQAQKLFFDMVKRADLLAREPQFYSTIGANCTTLLIKHLNSALDKKIPFTRQIILNGFSDRYAYDRGYIRNGIPFEELKQACRVDAREISEDENFSKIIRERRDRKLKALRGN